MSVRPFVTAALTLLAVGSWIGVAQDVDAQTLVQSCSCQWRRSPL